MVSGKSHLAALQVASAVLRGKSVVVICSSSRSPGHYMVELRRILRGVDAKGCYTQVEYLDSSGGSVRALRLVSRPKRETHWTFLEDFLEDEGY